MVWPTSGCEYHSDKLSNIGHIRRMHTEQLEGLAVTTLDEISAALPVNAFLVAESCERLLTPVSRFEESFDGLEIKYNGTATHRDQQAFVALCVARYLLERAGYFPDQMTVTQFARALMLPLERFTRDLQKGCGLDSLRRLHRHTPTQWICARIGDVYCLGTGYAARVSRNELGAAHKLLSLSGR